MKRYMVQNSEWRRVSCLQFLSLWLYFIFIFCREFFYIQMEKYARQAIAEGVKSSDDMFVTIDSEIYRVLNLHYNRNNQIEVSYNYAYKCTIFVE